MNEEWAVQTQHKHSSNVGNIFFQTINLCSKIVFFYLKETDYSGNLSSNTDGCNTIELLNI